MNPEKIFPNNEIAPHQLELSEEVEGFYLTRDVILKNKEIVADFFGDNRVDAEGRVNWYKKLVKFGVSLDSHEDFEGLDVDGEHDLPPLDPEKVLQKATKISEFFLKNPDAQAAFFAANSISDSE